MRFPLSKRDRLIISGIIVLLFMLWQVAFFTSYRDHTICSSCHLTSQQTAAYEEGPHADIPCLSCHVKKGVAGWIDGEVRSLANAFAFLTGLYRNPPSAVVDNATCLACHDNIKGETIKGAHVNVRHRDFLTESTSCLDCHSGVGHRVEERIYPELSMYQCTECHDDEEAPSDCSICHVGRKKEVLTANLEAYGKFHPENYLKMHGAEDMQKCNVCHEQGFCGKCHVFVKNFNVELPHPSSWVYTHWRSTDRSNIEVCYACHDQQRCDSCHGIEMPHPDNFLKEHSRVTLNYEPGLCLKCHDGGSCTNCHVRHVHPNFGTFHTPEDVLKK